MRADLASIRTFPGVQNGWLVKPSALRTHVMQVVAIPNVRTDRPNIRRNPEQLKRLLDALRKEWGAPP